MIVVDDDARNRTLLRSWLDPRHDVVEASDGASALAAIDGGAVDLVLLDVMMPGMSGFDVCREIKRRHAHGPFLPVILLTALGEQEDRNEGLRAGADDFLTKPCDRPELSLRAANLLRMRRQDLLIRRQVEQLKELSALKEDVVALILHDLRNPLGAALSLLHLVRGSVVDPELQADLDAALAAASRVRDTAEDLLDIRVLENGKLSPVLAMRSAKEVALEAARSLEGAARDRRITVRVAVDGDPAIPLDAKLLCRAIENLLSNAVRYSPEGGEIRVAVRRAGAAVEIDVVDRGPGVPGAARGGLFEKFGAVAAGGSESRRGYGLGLYLVKLVSEAHGGSISVHDAPGGGALFRLRIAGGTGG